MDTLLGGLLRHRPMPGLELIELRFAGGGPLDGPTLISEHPAGASFETDGGTYRLTGYRRSPEHDDTTNIAEYEWRPATTPDQGDP